MAFETITFTKSLEGITITINRPDQQNSINETFLKELNLILDEVEYDDSICIVCLEGQNGLFCTGMDLEDFALEPGEQHHDSSGIETVTQSRKHNPFMDTIKRISLFPKVVVAVVDGKVMAGGIGLMAACDLVIATPVSQFSLSEALWGLLPAMVTPFLIRRIGYQAAFRMTLTTTPVTTQKATEMGLIDEISEDPKASLRKLWLKLSRLDSVTITNMKAFFRKMWIINEQMEMDAIAEIEKLTKDPKVIKNISNYVHHKIFPWDKT